MEFANVQQVFFMKMHVSRVAQVDLQPFQEPVKNVLLHANNAASKLLFARHAIQGTN
jgi:hypothetical protein